MCRGARCGAGARYDGGMRTAGLFVEVRADDAAAAARRVREALVDRGEVIAAVAAPGVWGLDAVLPPAGDGRFGVEVIAPPDVAPAVAWQLAHALAAALPARVEPWFDGDVVPPELEPPLELHGVLESPLGRIGAWVDLLFRDRGEPPADAQWHLDAIGAREAHATLTARGIAPGAGVLIGHPDTGYTEHVEIWPGGAEGPIDVARACSFLPGEESAIDRLSDGPLEQPGHGTATASMIVARAGVRVPRREVDGDADLCGLAPHARIVPLRVTETVVILGWQRRLARAIETAVEIGCDVISISLGGLGGNRLERALRTAEEHGVIVVAAAGNVVRFVVAPATDPRVVACAASRVDGEPWGPSSRGAAVDVTAPGHHVWAAGWRGGAADAYPGSGTSFAAALTAGAAALWLGAHRDRLRALGVPRPQWPALFRRALAGTCERRDALPAGRYGAGLLRCDRLVAQATDALLFQPESVTPDAPDLAETFATRHALRSLVETAAEDAPGPVLEAVARVRLRTTVDALAASLDPGLREELVFHLVTDPRVRAAWAAHAVLDRTDGLVPPRASPALRDALDRWLRQRPR